MKTLRWIPALLLAALLAPLLVSCSPERTASPVAPLTGAPAGTGGYPWWNDAVFYEIFVRSFYDSDGDGIGDLNGIVEKLDTLNDGDPTTKTDLGVTGIWLMPIQPASSYHGYDVTDYYNINPDYGTLQDFKHLLDEADKRGIKVIIDLVLNHSSSEHPWFQSAQDKSSEFRDWYIWSETEPPGGGWHAAAGGIYLGIFDDSMPDLNYNNPQVTAEMQNIVRFWSEEVGVDGFRLDAAKHLIEEGSIRSHSDSTHAWYKEFRTFYKNLNPDGLLVGEIWDNSVTVSQYTLGDELDLAFDFDLAQALVTSARVGNASEVNRILQRDIALFPPGQFAPFLTNHDQARVMSNLADNFQKATIAASMLLSLPGVPFLYYGEEIGLLGLKPDELIRTPMQWNSETYGGFSNVEPWQPLNQDYQTKNYASQAQDAASLLVHYQNLVNLRNQHAALRIGETYLVQSDHPAIFSILRHSPNPLESLLILINLSDQPVSDYSLSLSDGPLSTYSNPVPLFISPALSKNMLDPEPVPLETTGGFSSYQPLSEIPPYTTLIFQLQSQADD